MNHDDASPSSIAGQPPRILIVEPDSKYLGMLARRLGAAGFRVATATCATSAIAELHRGPVELVLGELYMPVMSGADLARAIRSESMWRDLPVMLITGRSRPDGAVRAYEAGADDVILKPFHFEVLIARIERRIARARAVRALRNDNAALDARIVTRAIEIGELRDRLVEIEAEHRRIARGSLPA